MWPRLSTATPDTCPSIQLFGSGFGQNGSTWNCGTPPTRCAAAASTTVVDVDIVTCCARGNDPRCSRALRTGLPVHRVLVLRRSDSGEQHQSASSGETKAGEEFGASGT